MAVVGIDCKNLKNNPRCPHGPTLKFIKANNGQVQEFFACSTYRDRKYCGFYLAVADKISEKNKLAWDLERKRVLPSVDHEKMEARLKEVKEVPAKDRMYCHTCGQLDLAYRKNNHLSHNVQSVISDQMLHHPSRILQPKEGNKKEAQYLFSPTTTQVIVENLQRAGVSRVLCLGTPRVHEYIQSLDDETIESLLLDMDHRYHSFWPKEKFVWFNMFNQHFFSSRPDEANNILRQFLSCDKEEVLILDPPFGGHVDPLAATVRKFSKLYSKINSGKELKVIWIFPYFRERHITERCSNLKMLDFKVDYDNHKEFSCGSKGRKLGSPVRIFTNMDSEKFILPEKDGYSFCQRCCKWTSPENRHCEKCNACTSKDGRIYVHCDECRKCVKPMWQHCLKCNNCLPVAHICIAQAKQLHYENTEQKHRKKTKFNGKQKLKVKKRK